MKRHEALLATTCTLALLSGCAANEDSWADKKLGCAEVMSEQVAEGDAITLQSLVRTIRVCYDKLPDEFRNKYDQANATVLRIPTRDGKEAEFRTYSDADVDSDLEAYVNEAYFVGVNFFPMNTHKAASRIDRSAGVEWYQQDLNQDAEWFNAAAPQKRITAVVSRPPEKPRIEVEPREASGYDLDQRNPAVVSCAQKIITGQIAESLRIDTQSNLPHLPAPSATEYCDRT